MTDQPVKVIDYPSKFVVNETPVSTLDVSFEKFDEQQRQAMFHYLVRSYSYYKNQLPVDYKPPNEHTDIMEMD